MKQTSGRLLLVDEEIVLKISGVSASSGFGDFTGLDAGRANFHPLRATRGRLYANRLQIRIEATWGAIVRVRDIVAELRSLAADFTTFGHIVFATSVIENQGL